METAAKRREGQEGRAGITGVHNRERDTTVETQQSKNELFIQICLHSH